MSDLIITQLAENFKSSPYNCVKRRDAVDAKSRMRFTSYFWNLHSTYSLMFVLTIIMWLYYGSADTNLLINSSKVVNICIPSAFIPLWIWGEVSLFLLL